MFNELDEAEAEGNKIDEIINIFEKSNLVFLQGGPGTGKTTLIINLILELLRKDNFLNIGLSAPTGKATTRLKESLNNQKYISFSKYLDQIEEKNLLKQHEFEAKRYLSPHQQKTMENLRLLKTSNFLDPIPAEKINTRINNLHRKGLLSYEEFLNVKKITKELIPIFEDPHYMAYALEEFQIGFMKYKEKNNIPGHVKTKEIFKNSHKFDVSTLSLELEWRIIYFKPISHRVFWYPHFPRGGEGPPYLKSSLKILVCPKMSKM